MSSRKKPSHFLLIMLSVVGLVALFFVLNLTKWLPEAQFRVLTRILFFCLTAFLAYLALHNSTILEKGAVTERVWFWLGLGISFWSARQFLAMIGSIPNPYEPTPPYLRLIWVSAYPCLLVGLANELRSLPSLPMPVSSWLVLGGALASVSAIVSILSIEANLSGGVESPYWCTELLPLLTPFLSLVSMSICSLIVIKVVRGLAAPSWILITSAFLLGTLTQSWFAAPRSYVTYAATPYPRIDLLSASALAMAIIGSAHVAHLASGIQDVVVG